MYCENVQILHTIQVCVLSAKWDLCQRKETTIFLLQDEDIYIYTINLIHQISTIGSSIDA